MNDATSRLIILINGESNEANCMIRNSAKLDCRTKQHTQSGVSTSDGSRDLARTKSWQKKKKKKRKKMNACNPIKRPLRGSLMSTEHVLKCKCVLGITLQVQGTYSFFTLLQSPLRRLVVVLAFVLSPSFVYEEYYYQPHFSISLTVSYSYHLIEMENEYIQFSFQDHWNLVEFQKLN